MILNTLGGLALDQAALRTRLQQMTRQASTGQRGESFGTLGPEARRSVDLRGDIARRGAYVAAADTALARMGTAQDVLGRLQQIANATVADLTRARSLGPSGVQALASAAKVALAEVATLLNTQQGGEYLFAGSDLHAAPVPDGAGIAGGAMAGAIAAAVGSLDPTNAATVLATTATAATDTATTPFGTFLEGSATTEPRRAVQIGEGERVAWGVLANQDKAGEVAQSWGREMLRGLAIIAALTPASATQGAGYDALLAGAGQALDGAARDLAQESGALGGAEQHVAAVKERHANLLVTIRAQLATVEEVDLAEVSATLTQTQTRLEASYRITAQLAQLSLAQLLR